MRDRKVGIICGMIVNMSVLILFVLLVFNDFIVLKFRFLIFLVKSFLSIFIEWIFKVNIFENEFGLIVLINISVIIIFGKICIIFKINLLIFEIGCNFIILFVFRNVNGI